MIGLFTACLAFWISSRYPSGRSVPASCRGSTKAIPQSSPCRREGRVQVLALDRDLFLEQRVENDGAGAGVLHPQDVPDLLAQRRRGNTSGFSQLQSR